MNNNDICKCIIIEGYIENTITINKCEFIQYLSKSRKKSLKKGDRIDIKIKIKFDEYQLP